MYYDDLDEMYNRYAAYLLPGFSVSHIDIDYAFADMEQEKREAELLLIDTALSEYAEYRATVNPPTAEPVPQHQLDVERITELLGITL